MFLFLCLKKDQLLEQEPRVGYFALNIFYLICQTVLERKMSEGPDMKCLLLDKIKSGD